MEGGLAGSDSEPGLDSEPRSLHLQNGKNAVMPDEGGSGRDGDEEDY